ncbi:unannotated protein [freshwater metagenome]|uniref:Unannotated protein n=1 Tax=freshwater metagenome TaxID=449393 RepID=A0A6J7HUE7_9ZZZZ|nr:hypothetical protein [Actinomycetota bacterium]
MVFNSEAWQLAVAEGARVGDETLLRALWEEGRQHLGAEANALWTKALSGLDAEAVTG